MSAAYDLEVGFHNGFLVSQEFTRNLFADHDSSVRPNPAHVLVLDAEVPVSERFRGMALLTIPTREEVVERKGREPWRYYYPKSILVGAELDVLPLTLGESRRQIEHRVGFGLNTPLSHRFASAIFPIFSFRIRVQTTENSGLLFGAGYSGNGDRGLWFIPFGVSYRL